MSQRNITLREIWQIAWNRKFWLILPLLVVTGVAFAGSYLLPTIYESSTVVVISNQKFISPALERMLPDESGVLPEPRARHFWLAATTSEITSSGYLNEMIESLKLEAASEIVKSASEMRDRFPENNLAVMTRSLQIEEIRKLITVELIGENQVLITCRSENPRMAAAMAKSLSEIYRDKKLAGQVLAGHEGQTLTDNQRSMAKTDFENAEHELAEFKAATLNRQLQSGISSEANLGLVESEVDAARLELREATDRVSFLKGHAVEAGLSTDRALAESPELERHKRTALGATRQIADLMPRYLWSDGKIQGLLIKTSDALDSMRVASMALAGSAYPDAAASLKTELGDLVYRSYQRDFLTGKERILGEAIKEIKGLIAGQPYSEQMTQRLEDKVSEKRKAYQTWQDEADKLKIQRATNEAEAGTKYTILEPASIPLAPASPNRFKITLMGLALGMVLGISAVIVTEVVDHSIKRIEDIEELFGLEVVGTIPNIDSSTRIQAVKVA